MDSLYELYVRKAAIYSLIVRQVEYRGKCHELCLGYWPWQLCDPTNELIEFCR